ncbi:hypothetical protein AWW66_25060 [Micromonospora rosaria]|uniref:Uncharacterized protein n=1 Tax=Micromonospora rosaria TaxID=47874 RepID=A0A136PLN6_9ACTN|nr:hypothetical protein [Micromonospora rosaria]KXK59304.1 hypothetical protein AWW66_25060 [Micromonospora rosaria]
MIADCPSISGGQEHAFTVTTTVDQDRLITKLTRGTGVQAGAVVTDSADDQVCYFSVDAGTCQLGPAGTYTVTVRLPYPSGSGSYTLAVQSTRTPAGCQDLPESFFSFASPGITETMPAGTAARCFRFDQPADSVLHVRDMGSPEDIQGQILDADHEALCTVRYVERCELSGPGPYRLLLGEYYGTETTYTLRMPRLSQATGCPALPLASFGDPGTAVGGGTVHKPGEVTCHALTAGSAEPVVVRVDPFHAQYLLWSVYDSAGDEVCESYAQARHCPLPAAGAYTVLVRNPHWFIEPTTYQVAVTGLGGTDGCTALVDTSWAPDALQVRQTSPVQTTCQPFQGEAGDRMVTYLAPEQYNRVRSWLLDPSGTPACTSSPGDETGCVLPATGTYRLISHLAEWSAGSTDLMYRVQIRRLSAATGCPSVTPGAYNAAPAGGVAGVRCRSLEIPAAGTYRVKAVSADNHQEYPVVYDAAGLRVCAEVRCEFPAAGTYTLVLGANSTSTVIDNDHLYAVALLPWTPSGCPQASDAGWQDDPAEGTFGAVGQYDCRELTSPVGARVLALAPGNASTSTAARTSVVDAAGTQVCEDWQVREYGCELAGVAPFSVVVEAANGVPAAPYRLAFVRVTGSPACPALASDPAGSTVTTGPDRFVACFSLPAGDHAARESFTWTRTSGTGRARLWLWTEDGTQPCTPGIYAVTRTVTCALPPGPVTVLLQADAVDATYRVTHQAASPPPS